MECLCLGPEGSGKTLLLKCLKDFEVDMTTSTVETVGTNIVQIPRTNLSKEKKKSQRDGKDMLGIREIGGCMAPIWPSYFKNTKLIIFVIDSSNLFQVSISTVLLMELLSHEKLVGVKFLLVLAKKDLTNREKINYLRLMMRLENIKRETGQRMTVRETCSVNGEGVEEIRKWISDNIPVKGKSAKTVQNSLP